MSGRPTCLDTDPAWSGELVEEPPALNAVVNPVTVADSVRSAVMATRMDPDSARAELLADNPRWASIDADQAIASRQRLDLDHVTMLLDAADWNLMKLIAGCPVPVGLLVADSDSALAEPDRSAIMRATSVKTSSVIRSGHSIHRDGPGLWLRYVLQFVASQQEWSPTSVRNISSARHA